ncbi:MAG: ABC transporter ATP-binding protein [Desulfurococcaceae archaeon]
MVLAIHTEKFRVGYLYEDEQIVWAVRDIDISVPEGSAFCLVGESGSGKTTLASAVAGTLPPHSITEGKLYIFNRPVIDGPLHRYNNIRGRVVSLVPQNPGTSLNPFITVEEHFNYLLKNQSGTSKKRVREIASMYLSKVGLDARVLDMYPHELSGGMQQRVLISLALVNNARILVADEPTSSIDASLKAQIINLINQLRVEFKLTVFMVTHDILVAGTMCDVIAVMYRGKIVEVSTSREIISNPRHPYTKMLLESTPILGVNKVLKSLPGEPPNLIGEQPGCVFTERCPYRDESCKQEPPLKLVNADKSHYLRCWKLKEPAFMPPSANNTCS